MITQPQYLSWTVNVTIHHTIPHYHMQYVYMYCYQVHITFHAGIVTVCIMQTVSRYPRAPCRNCIMILQIRFMISQPQYVSCNYDFNTYRAYPTFEKNEVLCLNKCIVQNLIETGLKSKMSKVYAGRYIKWTYRQMTDISWIELKLTLDFSSLELSLCFIWSINHFIKHHR